MKHDPGVIVNIKLSYAYSNQMPVEQVKNKAGKFVEPTSASATAAIDAFQAELTKDVRTPIVDPPASAPDAYPITGLTFLIIPKDGSDRAKRQALKDFVQYVITHGQSLATSLNYAQLPDSLKQLDQTLLGQMMAGGQPLK